MPKKTIDHEQKVSDHLDAMLNHISEAQDHAIEAWGVEDYRVQIISANYARLIDIKRQIVTFGMIEYTSQPHRLD